VPFDQHLGPNENGKDRTNERDHPETDVHDIKLRRNALYLRVQASQNRTSGGSMAAPEVTAVTQTCGTARYPQGDR
jgi:hypothetical protein